MENNPLISIIVPVYNVEYYLDRCVLSILNQSYRNIEVILVDDGSTDNSAYICDSYIKKDDRIKVYHKKNGGLSSARNYGINKSNGEYITFIDSDDDIEVDYIKYLYDLIKKYNTKMSIATYTIITKKRKKNIGKKYKEELLDTENALSRLLCEKGFTVSSCAKLYKKNLFDNIKFPVGKLYEDNAVTYKLIMKCVNIAYGNKSIYNYYIRNDSITRKKFNEKKLNYIELVDNACIDILKTFPNLNTECIYKKTKTRFNIFRQMCLCSLDCKLTEKKREIILFMKKNLKQVIFNNCASFSFKIVLLVLFFNSNILKWVIYFYEKYSFK